MDDAADRAYVSRENLWDEQMPMDEDSSDHPFGETDNENEESPFPETVGTRDPLIAARDAEPYIAPIDPPVLPGGEEGVHVATGFGTDVEEEASRDSAPRGDEDIREEALRALRDDSLTSTLDVHLTVREGVVYLRGRVPSADDAEYAQSMLGELPGVVDVVDDTEMDPDSG